VPIETLIFKIEPNKIAGLLLVLWVSKTGQSSKVLQHCIMTIDIDCSVL
jgi:hypothetical protein